MGLEVVCSYGVRMRRTAGIVLLLSGWAGGQTMVGIVSQSALRSPFVGGYRLLVRHESDFGGAPLFLLVTGGHTALP